MEMAHVFGMYFDALEFDKPNDPVAKNLPGAVGVVAAAQHLADLVHELEVGVGGELGLVVHV